MSVKALLKKFTPALTHTCHHCNSSVHAFDLLKKGKEIRCPSCNGDLDHNHIREQFLSKRIAYKRSRLKKKRDYNHMEIIVPNSRLSLLPGLIFAFSIIFVLRDFPLPNNLSSWHIAFAVAALVYLIAGRPWHVYLTRQGVEVKRRFSPFSRKAYWSATFKVIKSTRHSGERRAICLNAIEDGESHLLLISYSKSLLEAVKLEIEDFKKSMGLSS